MIFMQTLTINDMKLTVIFSILVTGFFMHTALAFDITTHVAITAKAVEQSKFGSTPNTSELLARLGLRDAEGIFGGRYVGFGSPVRSRAATSWEKRWMKEVREGDPSLRIPTDFTMTGWIMRGAVREDDNTFETPRINETDSDPAPVFNRVFGHFFNPVGNAGLITSQFGRRGPSAPDWALVPNANIPEGAFGSRENNYKISDAREAMWRALTLKQILANGTLEQITPIGGLVSYAADEAERKAYWAATFRTLGDAVHLLQDMAQPQHTRLDSHSGVACIDPNNPDATCLGGHASFFENYLKARTLQSGAFSLDETSSISVPPVPGSGATRFTTRPQLNYAGYAVPVFGNYRDFFATDTGAASATGRGLANYSNRGFYSFGTNINDSLFLAPSPTGAGLGSETISGDAFTDMTGRKLPGALKVRTGIVEDHVDRSKDAAGVRLSTEGLWDQFLQQYGGGQPRYTLNYYNYDDQAKLLIPRAVAYSAGLIDYFFRGQLEIRPPEEGVYAALDHSDAATNCKDTCGFKRIKLKVANATPDIAVSGSNAIVPQPMSGGTLVAVAKYHKNTCYTTDLEGEYDSRSGKTLSDYLQLCRSLEEEISVSQPLANQSPVSCNATLADDCDTKANASTTLTFNFPTPIPINATDLYLQVVYRGPLGSEQDAVVVATKDIAEPTYFSIVNVSDYLICYNNSWVFKDSNGNLPASIPTMVDGKLATDLYKARNYEYWNVTFQPAQNTTLAQAVAIQPKEFARFAVLVEPGQQFNDKIAGYVDPVPPPYKLVTAGLNQSGFTATGSPTIALFDYKTGGFRKVKSHVPIFGYNHNTQGAGGICVDVPVPPEPTDSSYTKPTVMKEVTFTFP